MTHGSDATVAMADHLWRLLVIVGLEAAIQCLVVSVFGWVNYVIWRALVR